MRFWLFAAAVNGLCAVAVGAATAHAAMPLPAPRLALVETGQRYEIYHALALFGVAWLASARPGALSHAAGAAFLLGTILFSGGLYLIGFAQITAVLPLVPVGGSAFLAGWLLVGFSALRPWPARGGR